MADHNTQSSDDEINRTEKQVAYHRESLTDEQIAAERTTEEAMHFGELSEEELVLQKKLRRKIDSVIMPMVVLVYLMNFIDRNNYPAARLAGLQESLDMDDKQFQTGLSILFVGYILMQVPSNMLLNYSGRPSWYLGFWTVVWGLVSALTSLVQSYGQIVACRFILGFVEAPFFPGVLFYLSKWYTKTELNFRMALFFSGNLIAGAFGNLIAGGILNGLNGARGLEAWRWLYIIEGSITIVIGLAVVVILPDFPDTWKKLSPELKRVANRRMAIDAAEADVDVGGKMSYLQGAKLAFTDPRVYLLAIMYHCVVGATGFQNFFPSLTGTLGFDSVISLLLVAPPYIFVVFYSLGHSLLSDKLQHRFWFYIYPIPISIAGCFIFMFTTGFGPRYFSLFLLNIAFACFGTQYAWNSNVINRPPAKRAVSLAFMNSIGNAASIWTPFTYISAPEGEVSHYRLALSIDVGLLVVAGIGAVILRFMMIKMNRELDRLEDENVQLTEKEIEKLRKTAEFEGIDIGTARAVQKGFRYII